MTGWATQSIYIHKVAAGRPDRLLGYCIHAVEWCEVWCIISRSRLQLSRDKIAHALEPCLRTCYVRWAAGLVPLTALLLHSLLLSISLNLAYAYCYYLIGLSYIFLPVVLVKLTLLQFSL